MKRQQGSWIGLLLLGLILPALALAKSVSVEDGAHRPETDFSSVNGSVRIGADALVGDLDTVNGTIRVGSRSRAGRIESVNGGIHIASGAEVAGIQAVNGSIELEHDALVKGDVDSVNGEIHGAAGSRIGGSIKTVNGGIDLDRMTVEGDLTTYQGRIKLTGTEVHGDVHVRKSRGGWSWFGRDKATSVVIGPGTVVHGDLHFEKRVHLDIAESAQIGAIHGDDVEIVNDGRRYR